MFCQNRQTRDIDMRLGVAGLADTVLIAVSDGVLADSLRFALELEGFVTRFCDEQSLLSDMGRGQGACLVLDQDVFARMVASDGTSLFAGRDLPVILMVSALTRRARAYAAAAGITEVVEKPLLGGELLAAIRQTLEAGKHSEPR